MIFWAPNTSTWFPPLANPPRLIQKFISSSLKFMRKRVKRKIDFVSFSAHAKDMKKVFLSPFRWMNEWVNGWQMRAREILQDLNYTFKVIVVCVLNCKFSSASAAKWWQRHFFVSQLEREMRSGRENKGGRNLFFIAMSFFYWHCFCCVCVCVVRMRWNDNNGRITQIDELYHRRFHSFHASIVLRGIILRRETLFLISTVNFHSPSSLFHWAHFL